MSARRTPSGPIPPRAAKPARAARVPWLPYALGGLAIIIVVTAIIYAAVTGRLL